MALKLYAEPREDTALSDLDPFRLTFDGRIGGVIDTKIFIRNDDPSRWYETIQIMAVDPSGAQRVTGVIPGYFFQFAQKDTELFLEEWDLIAKGNQLTMSTSLGSSLGGDIVTYLPIWVRVSVPAGIPIQTIKDIILRINAVENLV